MLKAFAATFRSRRPLWYHLQTVFFVWATYPGLDWDARSPLLHRVRDIIEAWTYLTVLLCQTLYRINRNLPDFHRWPALLHNWRL